MDINQAKGIITPKGSLKRILSGGIVIWEKPSNALKYGIYKDNVFIEEVTLNEFIDKIHSGYAEENWGVGAEIRLPTSKNFYFGTFTKYGEGKLGLYATSPARSGVSYGPVGSSATSKSCSWANSYAKAWLNATGTEHGLTVTGYKNVKGFLGTLPEEFVGALNTITTFSKSTKIFLLSANQQCASIAKVEGPYGTLYSGGTDVQSDCWELWKQRIGTFQKLTETSSLRKQYNGTGAYVVTPTTVSYNANAYKKNVGQNYTSYQYIFDDKGVARHGPADGSGFGNKYKYFPACVIG